jgi:Flp pilus assembly protein TadB
MVGARVLKGTRMRILLLAFCGMLLLGSTVAFLLYVSILSILTVVVILMATMLMFVLGVQVERQRHPLPEILSEEIMPPVQETRAPFSTSVQA